ncbi:MAG: hypothetical protein AAGD10_08610 [Myxococcota bacterium]
MRRAELLCLFLLACASEPSGGLNGARSGVDLGAGPDAGFVLSGDLGTQTDLGSTSDVGSSECTGLDLDACEDRADCQVHGCNGCDGPLFEICIEVGDRPPLPCPLLPCFQDPCQVILEPEACLDASCTPFHLMVPCDCGLSPDCLCPEFLGCSSQQPLCDGAMCDLDAPPCPEGMVPVVADGCYDGRCVPPQACPSDAG